MTESQKKWAVGGTIGASAFFVGYLIFRGPHAGRFPKHEGHKHHKKHREGEDERVNDRGEYGRKKKHHHEDHKHG